ncbi:Hypothetical protein CAP_4741 [Chondromyces apiculatus DSM 436]|uniref:Putative restriction endonuclease domain-containing protein n=2 Tax=Chondromyces apiculatus TaxID=51 RepID=A0A017T4V3_9BACT|nr:Hypothetical protein CAP_4741 [Chondromyces apiculatus DSM 436]
MLPSPVMPAHLRAIRCHEVVPDLAGWVLTEGTVPQSSPHEILSERIKHLLLRWAVNAGRTVKVGRDLALRWDQAHPRLGVDPDVYVVEPPPPEGDRVKSLRLWQEGHVAPFLAVEIVSEGHPYKDYRVAPEKYAVCGVGELWVLDPDLFGPRAEGGPHRIQIWRLVDGALFTQVHVGEGPAWSDAVQGWLHLPPEDPWAFALSSDEAGQQRWLTGEETAVQREEAAVQREEAALQREEAALQRIAELEAQLARGPSGR